MENEHWMYIFVDESGIFANPQDGAHAVSCVVALVIAEHKLGTVEADFQQLRSTWGTTGDETKGSRLTETQVSEVIELLIRHEAIVETKFIDLGLHTGSETSAHKEIQAQQFTAGITPGYSPSLVLDLEGLQQTVASLSDPLYVQFVLSYGLAYRSLQTATLYWCLRDGTELANFHWVIDAKDTKQTDYERLWGEIMPPAFKYMSLTEPLDRIEGGDYSHFDRFYSTTESESQHDGDASIDANKIIRESIAFQDSRHTTGLQLSDVVASSFRRALVGNLQVRGWGRLGKLFIKKKNDTLRMTFLRSVQNSDPDFQNLPYWGVLQQLCANARPLFPR